MPRFTTKDDSSRPIEVYLESHDGDVDVYIKNILVGYWSEISGSFKRLALTESEVDTLVGAGVKIDKTFSPFGGIAFE